MYCYGLLPVAAFKESDFWPGGGRAVSKQMCESFSDEVEKYLLFSLHHISSTCSKVEMNPYSFPFTELIYLNR
jgi:hypothetical protein